MTWPILAAGSFIPFTGFDPLDGDDPHVSLSADNPCTRPRKRNVSNGGSAVAGEGVATHEEPSNRG